MKTSNQPLEKKLTSKEGSKSSLVHFYQFFVRLRPILSVCVQFFNFKIVLTFKGFGHCHQDFHFSMDFGIHPHDWTVWLHVFLQRIQPHFGQICQFVHGHFLLCGFA